LRCAASAGKTPSALDGQDFAVLYQLLPDGALETCAAGKEKIRALLGEPVRAPRAALEASAGHNVQMSWRRPMHMTTKCSRPFVGTIKWHRAAWRKPLQHGPHHGPHRTAHKSEHMRKQCAQTPRLARKQSSAQMHNCADTHTRGRTNAQTHARASERIRTTHHKPLESCREISHPNALAKRICSSARTSMNSHAQAHARHIHLRAHRIHTGRHSGKQALNPCAHTLHHTQHTDTHAQHTTHRTPRTSSTCVAQHTDGTKRAHTLTHYATHARTRSNAYNWAHTCAHTHHKDTHAHKHTETNAR
jgi:hypothetical protein